MTLETACYLAFVLGQLLFVLKRAASAIRNPNNTIKTRRDYLYANWDMLTIRILLEGVVFIACWHIGVAKILALFTSWQSPITFPAIPPFYFTLGFFVDSAVDWYAVSSIGPAFLREFVKENIPQINGKGAT